MVLRIDAGDGPVAEESEYAFPVESPATGSPAKCVRRAHLAIGDEVD